MGPICCAHAHALCDASMGRHNLVGYAIYVHVRAEIYHTLSDKCSVHVWKTTASTKIAECSAVTERLAKISRIYSKRQ